MDAPSFLTWHLCLNHTGPILKLFSCPKHKKEPFSSFYMNSPWPLYKLYSLETDASFVWTRKRCYFIWLTFGEASANRGGLFFDMCLWIPNSMTDEEKMLHLSYWSKPIYFIYLKWCEYASVIGFWIHYEHESKIIFNTYFHSIHSLISECTLWAVRLSLLHLWR